MRKADYSKISASYDKGRSLSESNIEIWLALISKYIGPRKGLTLLDLGCGTGRFALPIANRLNCRVVGADYSKEMLAKAQEKDIKGVVTWDYENAQNLTYRDATFDVVFMSHLLHHVDSPARVFTECKRILTTSGVILVRYGAIEQIRHDVEHTFFPEALSIDEARTPTIAMVEKWLTDAGFSDITTEEVVQQTFETSIAHLESAKVKNTSVLTMISQEAFDKGIDSMSEYIRKNQDDPWLLFDRLTLTVGYNSSLK
ncbi:MAG: methyltransferase domain-containing protein [Chloroflexota bacterium]|nr:MAG: methyltransferase domain-containing protein [Chloroflexota bacterium]